MIAGIKAHANIATVKEAVLIGSMRYSLSYASVRCLLFIQIHIAKHVPRLNT